MLKNKDIDLLLRVEHLIGDDREELGDLYKDFHNLIERELEAKRKLSKRVNEYHKRDPEKHRRYNREYAQRKKLLNKLKEN